MIRPHRSRPVAKPPTGTGRLPDGSPAPPYGIERMGRFLPFPPIPIACACGKPWVLAFPGTVEPPVRATEVLCVTCARDRGWPEILSRNSPTPSGDDSERTDDDADTSHAAGSGPGKAHAAETPIAGAD